MPVFDLFVYFCQDGLTASQLASLEGHEDVADILTQLEGVSSNHFLPMFAKILSWCFIRVRTPCNSYWNLQHGLIFTWFMLYKLHRKTKEKNCDFFIRKLYLIHQNCHKGCDLQSFTYRIPVCQLESLLTEMNSDFMKYYFPLVS